MRTMRMALLVAAVMSIFIIFATDSSYAATNNPVVLNGVTTWDCIWFGSYSQSEGGNNEKIKWRVLNVSNNKALLLSDTILDASKFHNGSTVTYENSAISGYLESIKGKMFNANEQAALSNLTLPSEAIMTNNNYGFTSSKSATDTRRAKSNTYVSSSLGYKDCFYWLSNTNSFRASYVKETGEIIDNFDNSNKAGIRPVVTIDLSKNVWSDAGTVDSNGKVTVPSSAADQKAAEKQAMIAANNGILDPTMPKVKISKPKAAKKSFTVKWKKLNKKQQKKVKGIEVEYSLTKDFKNPLFKIAGKNKANIKIKKLQSRKTYYVRAHTFVYKNGQKYFSKWSSVKKVKVK